MRSDYVLYTVAIIFFILTGVVAAYATTQSLWIVTTAVVGFVFIGLGYTQRPRETISTQIAVAPPPPPAQPTPLPTTEVVEEMRSEPMPETVVQTIAEAAPAIAALLEVKGIGEKRAQQLKELSINTVEELSRASAQDLASKLKISPKITGKWIQNAKAIVEKTR